MTKKVITLADELAIVARFHDQYIASLPLAINQSNASIWPFLHPQFSNALTTYKLCLEFRVLLSGEECKAITKVVKTETFKTLIDIQRTELGKVILPDINIADGEISVVGNLVNKNLSDIERAILEKQFYAMGDIIDYLNQYRCETFDKVFLNIFWKNNTKTFVFTRVFLL